ncbi:exonuclease domain-containing protein [Candidatus Omnitrophota bacterium]
MPEDINEIEFTIFDLETTGLNPQSGDRIIEIAAIRLKGKHRLGTLHSLVNPGSREVSLEAFAVNQIDGKMLKDAPDIAVIMPKFLDFIADSCLVAYNAPFDLGFLLSELRLIKGELPAQLQIADILAMAKRMLPGLERYPLWFVARHFGINNIQQHRALADVELTEKVFRHLSSMLVKKGVVDFRQFIGLFGLSCQLLNDINNAKMAQIQRALDIRASLKIRYLSGASAEITEREVIPRAVTQERNQVYLVAFCNLRNQERTFRIDNILDLQIGTSAHTFKG